MKREHTLPQGFTLLELVIVLIIAGVGLAATLPHLNTYFERQQLRTAAVDLGAYVDKAKTLAITTECRARASFTRSTDQQIRVQITVTPDPRWNSCQRWFEVTGHSGQTQVIVREDVLKSAELLANVTVGFLGLSGKVDGVVSPIRLRVRNTTGRIMPDGVGQQVVVYDN